MGAIYWIGTIIGVVFAILILLGPYAAFIIAGLILVGGMIAGFVRHK